MVMFLHLSVLIIDWALRNKLTQKPAKFVPNWKGKKVTVVVEKVSTNIGRPSEYALQWWMDEYIPVIVNVFLY